MESSEKNEIKPWLKDEWVIPPEQSAEFVRHMEDVQAPPPRVLEVHKRPHDERFPVVGLDEKPVQLLADVRGPLPGGPFQSKANIASAEGSVIVGYGYSASGIEAFRWTSSGGMVGCSASPPPAPSRRCGRRWTR